MFRSSVTPFRLRRLAVVLLLAAPSSRSQESAAAPLTLIQALARAAEHNPRLAAQVYEERAADALIEQAGLRPNPTLQIEAENFVGTGTLQGIRGVEATVQASQAIERGGKRQKRIALATRERDLAAKEFAVWRAEILAGTASAFIDALAAQHRLALAAEPLQLARETAATTASRVQAGVSSSAESARARAALATAQAEQARARAELNTARARLAAKWGGKPTDVASLFGSLQVPEQLPTTEIFLSQISSHPRLALQRAMIAGRRAALELEQARAMQDVTVGGGVRFLREHSDAGFVAGVSIPLPVRNQNQGSIRAARETLAGAEHTAHAIEAELRAAFAGAWQELAATHFTVQSLQGDVLPATREAHTIVRRAYEEGHLPLTDVLDAQRALVSLQRQLLDAQISYAAAHAEVEALADSAFPMTASLLSAR